MVELVAKSPAEGLLPVEVGPFALREVVLGRVTSIAPYRNKIKPLEKKLQSGLSLEWPAPGRQAHSERAELLWFGKDMAVLIGVEPDTTLRAYAALTDQSDAWTAVTVEGEGVVDVLARLCPLDLRLSVLSVGHTARTELAHMAASVTRETEARFRVMVFRSFARSLVHELRDAMEKVAARL